MLGDFTKQAAAYERARPGYPVSLLDRLVAEASVHEGDPGVDFGAGTGIFTRMLVEREFDVTAVEPNGDMIRRANLPEARWVEGSFEKNSLSDESQAWAVAAQAFHWANPIVALPQIRRVLKPGGTFTAVWNNRADDDSELLQWTSAAIRRHVPEFDEAYRNRPWNEELEATGDFTFVSRREVLHVVTMSKERYLDLWRSHNRLNNMAGPERFAVFFDNLSDHLRDQEMECVEIPYCCEAWSARRNA